MSCPLHGYTRRYFFASAGLAALGVPTLASARVPARQSDSSFTYEVSRTEEEWRSLLTETEYAVMREGFTEKPRSSLHWDSEEAGMYWCKGCELPVFDSRWKTVLPKKGWVFFAHAEPASVLTNIDGPTPELGSMSEGKEALTEIHCRRCASHLGHLLIVEGRQLHCINGTSLIFRAQAG